MNRIFLIRILSLDEKSEVKMRIEFKVNDNFCCATKTIS